jgi:hypothetical protein
VGPEFVGALGASPEEAVQRQAQEPGEVPGQLRIEKERLKRLEEENKRLRVKLEAERSKGF